MKKILFRFSKKQTADKKQKKQDSYLEEFSTGLNENLMKIKNATGNSSDVVIREFSFGHDPLVNAAIIFIDGLTDTKIINGSIVEPLIYKFSLLDSSNGSKERSINYIEKAMLAVSGVKRADSLNDTMDGFLSGDAALLIDGMNQSLIISCKGWDKRSITEPASESVVRGPRESFTEDLRTNTSLIRRKIKNATLTFESKVVGKKTKTDVYISYIKGVANQELIDTIKKRIEAIDIDTILESGYIEQYIEDSPDSIFATIGYTEKPDVVAAKLLEGRTAIIIDGTPFVLTVPYLFVESFQTVEDYYFRSYFMSLMRIIRCIAYVITVLSPAIYVAATTFHQELIPTNLLFTMARAREGIPFPAFVEAAIMLVTFEVLREAGIRLPRPVGQSLSIVGALVIGEAAVSAGLIGAPMVIVVSITAVSSFVVPSMINSASILRIILLCLGAVMGGYGITIGLLVILVHLSSLESFGFPFLSPTVPFDLGDSKDAIMRMPLWLMTRRPKGMAIDKERRRFVIPPAGESDDEE